MQILPDEIEKHFFKNSFWGMVVVVTYEKNRHLIIKIEFIHQMNDGK